MKLSPKIQPYDADEYIVLKNFVWKNITVPEGFIFDGATIPRFLWATTGHPFMPKYVGPALIHDYLYRTKSKHRKDADRIFRDLLRKNGVGKYQRNKMYAAVRSAGWMFYGRKEKK